MFVRAISDINFVCSLLLFLDIREMLSKQSVVALVNDKPWDMHRPLTEDCTLSFCHFKQEDPHHANTVLSPQRVTCPAVE